MSGLPILDLVVGVIFIYFILSIICSSAVELWFTLWKTRARVLEQWLTRIFDSPSLNPDGTPSGISLGQAIMDHCMVTALSPKGASTSYINAENFVSALLDKITIERRDDDTSGIVQPPPNSLAKYITAIQNSTVISGELKRTILAIANDAQQAAAVVTSIPAGTNLVNNITSGIKSEMDHFRERLEHWYDTNADRLTGTMKRKKSIPATIIIGTILTIGLNADSVKISSYLYDHKEEAKQFADKALISYQAYADRIEKARSDSMAINGAANVAKLDSNLNQVKADIDSLKSSVTPNFPLGWKSNNVTDLKSFLQYSSQLKNLLGWIATVLAICLGAPFWFDILNKIANLRSTGPKPTSKADGNSNKAT